jgi:hypothetical protein
MHTEVTLIDFDTVGILLRVPRHICLMTLCLLRLQNVTKRMLPATVVYKSNAARVSQIKCGFVMAGYCLFSYLKGNSRIDKKWPLTVRSVRTTMKISTFLIYVAVK